MNIRLFIAISAASLGALSLQAADAKGIIRNPCGIEAQSPGFSGAEENVESSEQRRDAAGVHRQHSCGIELHTAIELLAIGAFRRCGPRAASTTRAPSSRLVREAGRRMKVMGIVGWSGSGKTSLARVLADAAGAADAAPYSVVLWGDSNGAHLEPALPNHVVLSNQAAPMNISFPR